MKLSKMSPWAVTIFVVYSAFVIFLIVRVIISYQNDVELISPDYYQKGVVYQERIESIKRVKALKEKISFFLNRKSKTLILHIPRSFTSPFQGSLNFFRPSDGNLDFTLPIQIDRDGNQTVDLSNYKSGFWRLKINWIMAGLKYYQEEVINIP